jgi:hypothetical protein
MTLISDRVLKSQLQLNRLKIWIYFMKFFDIQFLIFLVLVKKFQVSRIFVLNQANETDKISNLKCDSEGIQKQKEVHCPKLKKTETNCVSFRTKFIEQKDLYEITPSSVSYCRSVIVQNLNDKWHSESPFFYSVQTDFMILWNSLFHWIFVTFKNEYVFVMKKTRNTFGLCSISLALKTFIWFIIFFLTSDFRRENWTNESVHFIFVLKIIWLCFWLFYLRKIWRMKVYDRLIQFCTLIEMIVRLLQSISKPTWSFLESID